MPAAQIDPQLTTPNPQPNNFPCGVCRKNVNANHKAFCCDQCDLWVHIRCNYLNNKDYTNLQHDPEPFFCINCIKETIPHSNLTDNEIKPLLSKGIILPDNVDVNAFNAPSPRIQSHIDNINAFLTKASLPPDESDDDDEENVSPINCNYYTYEEFSKAKFDSSTSFSILHLNIHSIQLHIESLQTLLLSLESDNFEFDIVAISESKF